ncbi:zona pellucida sperm-binding protein 3-like [Osmerus mordax]|uniref:zona pellucida sperm-binding protein 3-like n=1 Tax=Osmerus mordax TaxID=8014 RepID=UPI00350FF36E
MASRVRSDIAGNPYNRLEILPDDIFVITSNPKFVPTQSQSPNILQSIVDPEVKDGFKIECGETKMQITVKREFFETRGICFSPDLLHLGENLTSSGSCRAVSEDDNEIVISSELLGCGSKSRVIGDWLVYSNVLVLTPGLFITPRGILIFTGARTVIPIECHYRRKQRVSGEPLSPTWLPMISTITAFGLLHFTLRTMTYDWSSPRSSSVYQQGEPVFLEASVKAPLHPPLRLFIDNCVATLTSDPLSSPSYKFITEHGCLVDSLVSPSQFYPRAGGPNTLRFAVQTVQFSTEPGDQTFITCHMRATLARRRPDPFNKACSFHWPSFRWRALEGDGAVCLCCHDRDCSGQTLAKSTTQAHLDTVKESDTMVGPLQIQPSSYWMDHLSLIKDLYRLNLN